MVYFGLEGDFWTFVWIVLEFKLYLEPASLEWSYLRTVDDDTPVAVVYFCDVIASKL